MFDFLKRIFRKKTEPSTEKIKTEPIAQERNEPQKPVSAPVPPKAYTAYTPVSTTAETRPVVQKPAVRPVEVQKEIPKPVVQAAEVNKKAASIRMPQPVVQEKTLLKTAAAVPEKQAQPAVRKNTVPKKETAAAPSAAPAARSTAARKVVAPRSQQGHVESSAGKRVQKTSVYIGLDFGTTFTKAAYEIAPSNVHTKYSVRFGRNDSNEDYYLHSVLYFDPAAQKLKIHDDAGDCEEIRYFKYNMISDALHTDKINGFLKLPLLFEKIQFTYISQQVQSGLCLCQFPHHQTKT